MASKVEQVCLQHWTIAESSMQKILVIEEPELWHSGKGLASARTGSLQTLFLVYGAVLGRLLDHFDEAWCVGARTWKGNVPKEVMMRRASAILDVDYPSHDVAEAVCLAAAWTRNVKGLRTPPNGWKRITAGHFGERFSVTPAH